MKKFICTISLCITTFCVSTGPVLHAQEAAPPAKAPAHLTTEAGYGVFEQYCTSCHGNPNAPAQAPSAGTGVQPLSAAAAVQPPSPAQLWQLSPERIYESLTTGSMRIEGQALTDEQKRRVSESMSGRHLGTAGTGDANKMPNRCSTNPSMADPSAGPAWNGWGVDITNSRFQSAQAAGLSAEQVPNLKLKWAFGFPGGVNTFGQPSVVSGRVFVGSDTAYVYSLDAATGCVYWSFQTQAGVRNAMIVAPIKGHGATKYAVYFGDLHSNVYALDAQTGKMLWTKHVDEHFTSRLTAAPTLYAGRLYVPVSSFEEYSAKSLDYPCCTFQGSVLALDANTGKQIWKTYVITERPKPTRKNSKGTQLWAPAGGAVWNSPTVDVKRHAIYVGTGDCETEPAVKTTDAAMALDMNTGKILWYYQTQADDSFLVGCRGAGITENCPKVEGPDYDIGNSPLLGTLKNGKQVVMVGTKDGDVVGMDPDNGGKLLWRTKVTDVPRSGMYFGGAVDDQFVYYGLSEGGAAAVRFATGELAWFAPVSPAGKHVANVAAVTTIPGVLFVGGEDGTLRALSTTDGHGLWEYDTNHEFTTVNGVPAKGGSMRAPGATVAGGMLFVGSGYAIFASSTPGNVLLAFSPQ
jgi:polyvinyl alcohol dehydrogenase (cytochrome)